MTAQQFVAVARRLLDETPAGTTSAWSRAAALLCRQALEGVLSELWAARAPSLRFASMRAQLSCLPFYLSPPALTHVVAFSWYVLSHAMHHHPYELDPTREELDSLITTTRRLIASVSVQAHARAAGTPSR